MYDAALQSQRVISFLLSRRSCVFFFQRFGNWSSLRIFNFFSSTLTRRFLRIATRISYFVRWIKARQSNWILYYTEQSWKSLWNEISCRFDGIIKIIRNFSFFFFFNARLFYFRSSWDNFKITFFSFSFFFRARETETTARPHKFVFIGCKIIRQTWNRIMEQ